MPFWTRRMYCFLLWLSSDLGGVAVLDPPNVLSFAVAELGFRWCLAVSHAWRKSCGFGFFGLSRLGCAMFWIYVSTYLRTGAFSCFRRGLLRTGARFLFLGGSKGAVLDPPNVLFFAVAELGFRWCLAVSHAWRKSCVFGFFGLSRLGCAMFWIYVSTYLRTRAFFFFSQRVSTYWCSFLALRALGASKGAVLDPPNVLFFAVAELGFRWCLAVSHPWPRRFGLSRLGCAVFWIYVVTYLRTGAFFLFSQGVATYWGSFLVLRGFQRFSACPG